jgi:hypothetical protein
MIPNVFVSSTIDDLHHFRDAIRDVIIEIGYVPIMSEYGDIGYLPSTTAEDSCYVSMKQCDLAILIIGKRYGPTGEGRLSVTHREFRTAREYKIPVFSFIDSQVLSYKVIFDANPDVLVFPGMDNPRQTFALIDEIKDADSINNGFQSLSTVADARQRLKAQLAHFFGALLQAKMDPVKQEVKDILSEIKTLRHELKGDLKGERKGEAVQFLKAIRFLLDDDNRNYRQLVECFYETLDMAIPTLIVSASFDEFIETTTGKLPQIGDVPAAEDRSKERPYSSLTMATIEDPDVTKDDALVYAVMKPDGHLVINETGYNYLQGLHKQLRDLLRASSNFEART